MASGGAEHLGQEAHDPDRYAKRGGLGSEPWQKEIMSDAHSDWAKLKGAEWWGIECTRRLDDSSAVLRVIRRHYLMHSESRVMRIPLWGRRAAYPGWVVQ